MDEAADADIVVEVVDMEVDDQNDMIEDVDMEDDSVDIKTFLLQMKLQLDERDAALVQFGYESDTSVLVDCFVPLLDHSSMLPIIPLTQLRISARGREIQVEILSNTHIQVPHELVEKLNSAPPRYFLKLPSPPNLQRMEFVQVVPAVVRAFIQQIHTFDPHPPPQVTRPAPSPVRKQGPAKAPPDSTLFPLAHVPGTLFHANDVNGSVVTPILVGVSSSSLYLLHPTPQRLAYDLAILKQLIPLKDIAKVAVKRGENKSFVVHSRTTGAASKVIFSQNSERIVALVQANMEKRSAKRRRDSNDPPPRVAKKNSGFDMSSFFSSVEKATKELSQKVVGGLNEMGKLLSGDSRPNLAAISQMEADFFRHPSPHQLFAITESYKNLGVDTADDGDSDLAGMLPGLPAHLTEVATETNLILFLGQPQVQRVLHQ
ncbi:unnamed protein product [Aphanomyces euteiches]|nr:hypothetical protein Ae201684P_011635 [Aphanomyces euteiches]KAH9141615.1 hypothetical protein AeRB84_014232 [Aphanomyces euteiches]